MAVAAVYDRRSAGLKAPPWSLYILRPEGPY